MSSRYDVIWSSIGLLALFAASAFLVRSRGVLLNRIEELGEEELWVCMDAGKPQTAAELNGRTCLKLLIKTVCTHSASLTPSVCNPCAALSKAEVFFVREFNPKQIDTWKGSQRHVRVLLQCILAGHALRCCCCCCCIR